MALHDHATFGMAYNFHRYRQTRQLYPCKLVITIKKVSQEGSSYQMMEEDMRGEGD